MIYLILLVYCMLLRHYLLLSGMLRHKVDRADSLVVRTTLLLLDS